MPDCITTLQTALFAQWLRCFLKMLTIFYMLRFSNRPRPAFGQKPCLAGVLKLDKLSPFSV
jgi:hypothetical protein